LVHIGGVRASVRSGGYVSERTRGFSRRGRACWRESVRTIRARSVFRVGSPLRARRVFVACTRALSSWFASASQKCAWVRVRITQLITPRGQVQCHWKLLKPRKIQHRADCVSHIHDCGYAISHARACRSVRVEKTWSLWELTARGPGRARAGERGARASARRHSQLIQ